MQISYFTSTGTWTIAFSAKISVFMLVEFWIIFKKKKRVYTYICKSYMYAVCIQWIFVCRTSFRFASKTIRDGVLKGVCRTRCAFVLICTFIHVLNATKKKKKIWKLTMPCEYVLLINANQSNDFFWPLTKTDINNNYKNINVSIEYNQQKYDVNEFWSPYVRNDPCHKPSYSWCFAYVGQPYDHHHHRLI